MSGPMKNRRLAATTAIWLALFSLASSSTAYGAEQVTCWRADLLVALAPHQPAAYSVTGEFCATPHELQRGGAVQLLIHDATYSREYWDFGSLDRAPHSYARAAAAAGIATFAFDEIGAGGSSHPASNLITVDAAAHVAHQIVQALRHGDIGGTRFREIIAVGHSLGSVVAWDEAIRYADVDGVIVTGAAHSLSSRYQDAQSGVLLPAAADPRFITTGLDQGYLMMPAAERARWFFAAATPADEGQPAEPAYDDVVAATELATAHRFITSAATRGIHVPVLIIVGSADATICGPSVRGGYFDCSSAAAVARQEAPFYSRAARLHACVIRDAGHDLNMTVNHDLQLADALAWSVAFIDRRVDSDAGRSRVSAVSLTGNDDLPPNCASAGQNDKAGSRYARTSAPVP
jgi:pimeloyl-ACP methyl ester carboxylesterase